MPLQLGVLLVDLLQSVAERLRVSLLHRQRLGKDTRRRLLGRGHQATRTEGWNGGLRRLRAPPRTRAGIRAQAFGWRRAPAECGAPSRAVWEERLLRLDALQSLERLVDAVLPADQINLGLSQVRRWGNVRERGAGAVCAGSAQAARARDAPARCSAAALRRAHACESGCRRARPPG